MERRFKQIIDDLYLKLDDTIKDLSQAHQENLEKLEEFYNNAVDKILAQKIKFVIWDLIYFMFD